MKPPPKQFKDNTDPEWSPMEEDEEGTLESGEDIKRDHIVHSVEERQLLTLFEVCNYPGFVLVVNPDDLKIVNEGS